MKSHLVLLQCQHWFVEYTPDDFMPDPEQPRVCSNCPPWDSSRFAELRARGYERSAQGLMMSPAFYVPVPDGLMT